MSSPSTRKQCDFTKLLLHGYEVELKEGSTQDFYVTFKGPKETLYGGAFYRIHVELPEQYPFASPSIGFEPHSIFHPNIDERSGSVCLDVINQTWTPLYSLINIFDVFLPQLLTYPNAADPLNGDAANLFMKDRKKYEEKVKMYVANSIKRHEERQQQKSEDQQKRDEEVRSLMSTCSPRSNASNDNSTNSPMSRPMSPVSQTSFTTARSFPVENSDGENANNGDIRQEKKPPGLDYDTFSTEKAVPANEDYENYTADFELREQGSEDELDCEFD